MTTLQAKQSQVVILLGPPGAGKGSQAVLIKEKLSLAHISTGDLLRENIKQGTPLGKQAQVYMDKGELVPDSLIFDMLFTRVERPDCKNGYILDGFPRNLEQAKELQKRLAGQKIVAINFKVPDATLIERITKREICKGCQAPYHRLYSPPKIKGKCDLCEEELYQRSDDSLEVVQKRLEVYHKQTAPLVDFYSSKKVLHTIPSDTSKEAILLQALRILQPAPTS